LGIRRTGGNSDGNPFPRLGAFLARQKTPPYAVMRCARTALFSVLSRDVGRMADVPQSSGDSISERENGRQGTAALATFRR
jgi:hypothetical protein